MALECLILMVGSPREFLKNPNEPLGRQPEGQERKERGSRRPPCLLLFRARDSN